MLSYFSRRRRRSVARLYNTEHSELWRLRRENTKIKRSPLAWRDAARIPTRFLNGYATTNNIFRVLLCFFIFFFFSQKQSHVHTSNYFFLHADFSVFVCDKESSIAARDTAAVYCDIIICNVFATITRTSVTLLALPDKLDPRLWLSPRSYCTRRAKSVRSQRHFWIFFFYRVRANNATAGTVRERLCLSMFRTQNPSC